MLVGIERGEPVDAQQGRKKKRLKAVHKRLLPVMQQSKVIIGIRALMGRYRLRELGHNRAQGLVLVKPMGKKMHAHIRQMGCDTDDGYATGHRLTAWRLTRASLAPIELPLSPPPVEMTDTHGHGSLLDNFVEEHSAWALRILVEQAPQQGLLNFTKLAPSTKGWT